MKYLYYIMSRFPIFSFTFDKLFHDFSMTDNVNFKDDCRISVFSFGFGARKLYFLTKKNRKCAFAKIINLTDAHRVISVAEATEKKDNYFTHISNFNVLKVNEEVEYLRYRIDSENDTKNMAFNKINSFNTVALIFIPLLLNSGFKLVINYKNTFNIIMTISFIYSLINVITWFFDYLKVKESCRSRFAELKAKVDSSGEDLDILKEKATLYYFDWINIKSEREVMVTYVKNIERYFKISLVIILILVIHNVILELSK